MINNEFNLIGIALTEYERDAYDNCLLRIEVEKMGSKEGNVFEAEIKIYGSNRMVDTKRSVAGRQIAVNGYIDSTPTPRGTLMAKLIAQRVYVLGEQRPKLQDAAEAAADVSAPAPSDVSPAVNAVPSDDDLPF